MPYQKIAVGWMFLLILFSTSIGRTQVKQPEYAVAQVLALHQKPSGIEGTLQLLTDKRLTKSVREQLWEKGDWSFVFPPDSRLYKEFSAVPPGKSKLRIRDSNGRVIVERDLETPLAKIEEWNPAFSNNQFLLLITEDYSTGVGSYNGLRTIPLGISDGTFHEMKALNSESHQEELIRLMKSLKSAWRISSRREGGGEILSVSCHLKNDGKFVIDYTRYSFDGSRWLVYRREVEGYWESSEAFPPKSAFP